MTVFGLPILSLIVFFPLVGVGLLFFVDRRAEGLAKWIALLVSGVTFMFSLPLFWRFQPAQAGFQFVEQVPWIRAIICRCATARLKASCVAAQRSPQGRLLEFVARAANPGKCICPWMSLLWRMC